MARQLVFTSAPQGLTPGRTGYCTVARHGDLRERLVPVLEGLSVYPPGLKPAPVICAFRLLDLSGTRVPVLTRIVDAGQDYTHRNNFLAHHLVFDPAEIADSPSPADFFLRWPGWLDRWEGAPRWLEAREFVDARALAAAPPALPAKSWLKLTGDAGHAALLVDGAQSASRLLRCAPGREADLLALFRESSALLTPAEAWRAEFTTYLQSTESAATFRWVGLGAGSASDAAAARTGTVLDLTQPQLFPPAPVNAASLRAREGVNTVVGAPGASVFKKMPFGEKAPRVAMPGTAGRIPAARARTAPSPVPLVVGGLVGMLIIGLAAMIWLSMSSNHPVETVSSTSLQSEASPPAAVSPVNPNPFQSAPAPAAAPATPSGDAIANEQLWQDIQRDATDGKYLAALDHWKQFASKTPDLARDHDSWFQQQLLPGAQQEWQTQLNKILADLNAGRVDRATLTTQLQNLQDFPSAWPIKDPSALEQSWHSVANILSFLNHLPDAPVWIVDDLNQSAAGDDYQELACVLNVPDLSALISAKDPQFKISFAAATSLSLPPPDQWFNFDLKPGDFASGDYLILHDATRGVAGGRFLQLLADAPGKVRLTLRVFKPTSDFFAHNPANARLQMPSGRFWLHFAGEPPLPSFYMLLRQPNPEMKSAWQPLKLPMAWLTIDGAPAQVTLPAWLEKNLKIFTPSKQSLWLFPPSNKDALTSAFNFGAPGAATLNSAHFDAGGIVATFAQQARDQQTSLARAQQTVIDLEKLASGTTPDKTITQEVIDQARQFVEKLKSDIAQKQAAAASAAQAGWPQTVAPWGLFYASEPNHLTPLLEFTSDATGTTP